MAPVRTVFDSGDDIIIVMPEVVVTVSAHKFSGVGSNNRLMEDPQRTQMLNGKLDNVKH